MFASWMIAYKRNLVFIIIDKLMFRDFGKFCESTLDNHVYNNVEIVSTSVHFGQNRRARCFQWLRMVVVK